MKIAALLTTYNRKDKTLACLESLALQHLPAGVHIEVFMTDDASTDGTVDAVQKKYPGVNIFHGTGSLFWAGGMRNTWRKALPYNPDYFLLLNDDTLLYPAAISELLQSAQKSIDETGLDAICIGSTVDPETGKPSYGGRKLASKRSWSSYLIHSDTDYLHCDLAHANILLVPSPVVDKIGILSEAYTHGLADYDYTLKARKAGIDMLITPGFLGTCVDDHGHNWKSHDVSLKERIKYLKSPKGLAYKEYLSFIREHFPLSYPSAFAKLWIKTFFPFIWDSLKK
jgi:GT2 family glycosyltransferase